MRIPCAIAFTALILAGCSPPGSGSGGSEVRGRYTGIGTYSPGQLWSRMSMPKATTSGAAATTADDEHVIVVVDSQSGQVRECGDYSGVCVSFNPWSTAVAKEQTSPVILTKHLADVQKEQEPTRRSDAVGK